MVGPDALVRRQQCGAGAHGGLSGLQLRDRSAAPRRDEDGRPPRRHLGPSRLGGDRAGHVVRRGRRHARRPAAARRRGFRTTGDRAPRTRGPGERPADRHLRCADGHVAGLRGLPDAGRAARCGEHVRPAASAGRRRTHHRVLRAVRQQPRRAAGNGVHDLLPGRARPRRADADGERRRARGPGRGRLRRRPMAARAVARPRYRDGSAARDLPRARRTAPGEELLRTDLPLARAARHRAVHGPAQPRRPAGRARALRRLQRDDEVVSGPGQRRPRPARAPGARRLQGERLDRRTQRQTLRHGRGVSQQRLGRHPRSDPGRARPGLRRRRQPDRAARALPDHRGRLVGVGRTGLPPPSALVRPVRPAVGLRHPAVRGPAHRAPGVRRRGARPDRGPRSVRRGHRITRTRPRRAEPPRDAHRRRPPARSAQPARGHRDDRRAGGR